MSTATAVDLNDPGERDIALRIGRAWIELRRGASMTAIRDHLFGSGPDAIEQGQMDTLDMLALRPSWRMCDLAEALRVDPSTATRAVQRLENAGLAERNPSEEDGRVVMATITRSGMRLHDDVLGRRSELMTHLMGRYDAAERATLADLLDRFVGGLDDFVAMLRERAREASEAGEAAGSVEDAAN